MDGKDPGQSTYVSNIDEKNSYKQSPRAAYKYIKLLQMQNEDKFKRANSSANKAHTPELLDEDSNENETGFKSLLDSRDMQVKDEGLSQKGSRIKGIKYSFGLENRDKTGVERGVRNKLHSRANNFRRRQFLNNLQFSKTKKLQNFKIPGVMST